jgi:hypothetical protein
MGWRKSSYSGANSNCTEARRLTDCVAVRDSKAPDRGVLNVGDRSWEGFITALKRDHFS